MKTLKIIFVLLLGIFLMCDVLPLTGQEAGTKPEVKKEVQVVNVELPIRVKGLSFKDKKLFISIENIFLRKTGKGKEGRIGIHIRILDHFNMLFEQKKLLTTQKDIVSIEIPLSNLIKGFGAPEIAVDVKDLYTGKTDSKSIRAKCHEHDLQD